MDHKIYTQFERPPDDAEVNTGESIVETAGYVPAERQIQSLIDAGVRLEDYRKGCDFVDGVDTGENDPTREPGFDLADASAMSRAANARIEERNRIAAEKAAKKEEDEKKEKEEIKEEKEEKK